MAELTFSVEELARSCYQAYCTAMAIPAEAWDRLGLDKHVPWLRLGQYGPVKLEQLEGCDYNRVALEMWLLTLGQDATASAAWDEFPRELRLGWEVVARHLMILLDADDVENVPALEQSWRHWLLGRLTPQEACA